MDNRFQNQPAVPTQTPAQTVQAPVVPQAQPAPQQSYMDQGAHGQHASYIQQEPEQWSQPDAYMVTMPPQVRAQFPGRTPAIFGMVCAVVALGFAPVIFGPAGITLGVVARKKGAATFGTITAVTAGCFMVLGFFVELSLAGNEAHALGVALGALFPWSFL